MSKQSQATKLTLHGSLRAVQINLKCPKNQINSFANYKFRNQEDILEAVKPLLDEYGILMTIGDNMVSVEGRVYCQSTVSVSMEDSKELPIVVTAFAREEMTRKGMDAAQITGTASSYARKYALNGMFLIDDTKDADTLNEHKPKTDEDEKAELLKIIEECPEDTFFVHGYLVGLKAIKEDAEEPKQMSETCKPAIRKRIVANASGFWSAVKQYKEKEESQ